MNRKLFLTSDWSYFFSPLPVVEGFFAFFVLFSRIAFFFFYFCYFCCF